MLRTIPWVSELRNILAVTPLSRQPSTRVRTQQTEQTTVGILEAGRIGPLPRSHCLTLRLNGWMKPFLSPSRRILAVFAGHRLLTEGAPKKLNPLPCLPSSLSRVFRLSMLLRYGIRLERRLQNLSQSPGWANRCAVSSTTQRRCTSGRGPSITTGSGASGASGASTAAAAGTAVPKMGLHAPPPPPCPHSSSSCPVSSSNIPFERTAQLAGHLSSSALEKLRKPNTSQIPSASASAAMAASPYSVRKNGAPNTMEHRVYIEKDGLPVSPFHDVPLYANQEQTILNMVVEIPRWTNGKLEVSFAITAATSIWLCFSKFRDAPLHHPASSFGQFTDNSSQTRSPRRSS